MNLNKKLQQDWEALEKTFNLSREMLKDLDFPSEISIFTTSKSQLINLAAKNIEILERLIRGQQNILRLASNKT